MTPNSSARRFVGAYILALIALMAVTTDAAAQEKFQALVFPFEGALATNRDDRSAITEVAQRLMSEGGAETSLGQSTLTDTALLIGCDPKEPDCLSAIGLTMSVDIVVTGTLISDGKESKVSLTVARAKQFPETIEIPIRGKTTAEVVAEFEQGASLLLAGRPPRAVASEASSPGSTKPVDAAGAAESNPATESSAKPPEPNDHKRRAAIWPTVVAASGLVLVGAGTAFWLSGRAKQGDIDDHPTGTLEELRALEELEDTAASRVATGRILVGVGLVTAAVGTVFFLKERKRGRTSVAVSPMLAPNGGGVAFSGSW